MERISVVMPILNEAHALQSGAILPVLRPLQAADVELVVVDGGSQDQTVTLLNTMGISVISSLRGRAYQMNAGATLASGDILLFLHSDTQLSAGFDQHIRQTLAQPGVIAGAFELRIQGNQPGLRLIEGLVNWRSRWLQLPYGDQAIFLKATVFDDLGGFPEQPIMEDFELMRRARRRGRIAIAPHTVLTSGRRWQTLGTLRTTLINQAVILAYLLGVSPEKIAHWYRQIR